MRTSLTFLSLLAVAGSAVAAPVPASNSGNGAVQKIVSGHHRRSDSTVNVDMTEHLVSPLNEIDVSSLTTLDRPKVLQVQQATRSQGIQRL